MISAVSINHWIEEIYDNNGTNATITGCIAKPTRCTYGNCTGGTCARCAFNPLLCCPDVTGRCLSFGGNDYGSCTPDCECKGC